VYLVPRPDGTVVIGATVEERGYDHTVQAGAVYQLLADARTVLPGIDEYTLLESATGLRPATRSNMPFLGWTDLEGVVAVATGHYRNGILLAPYTAETMVALVAAQA
jgi:glycine oxidase